MVWIYLQELEGSQSPSVIMSTQLPIVRLIDIAKQSFSPRIASGELPSAAIWDDITTLQGKNLPEIDIIYGGFPCQNISCTGDGKGLAGERSGLFFEIVRLCSELKPRFIFLENVPAIVFRGGEEVIKNFAQLGFSCRWGIVSAASCGARHIRKRFFLLAYAEGKRLQTSRQPLRSTPPQPIFNHDAQCLLWDKEPENKFEMAGVVNGLSRRVDRTKALGNAVVPRQAKKAFEILMGLNES